MKTITQHQLIEKITSIAGHTFATVESLTDARAKKTGNPYGQIFKQSIATISIGADYEKAVNRQAEREENENAGNFEAASLKDWQEWAEYRKIIRHKTKGTLYLRTQTAPGQRKIHAPKVLAYRNEKGEFLARESVRPFLPEKKASAKQESFGNEEQINVRDYALDSIRRIRLNGQTFIVKREEKKKLPTKAEMLKMKTFCDEMQKIRDEPPDF